MSILELILAEIRTEFEDEIQNIDEKNLKGVLPRVLTREECHKLINYYSGEKGKDIRNRLIIKVLYYSGIRISESAELIKADVNFNDGIVFIRSGKGDKDRYVCLDSSTLKELSLFSKNIPLTAKIFNITDRQIRRIVDEVGQKTGISETFDAIGRRFSPHSLRHAFATHCIENGMNVFTLKKLLGHEYLDTTEIYVNTSMKFVMDEYLKGWGNKKILSNNL
jgi:integrase/recombinase XerD